MLWVIIYYCPSFQRIFVSKRLLRSTFFVLNWISRYVLNLFIRLTFADHAQCRFCPTNRWPRLPPRHPPTPLQNFYLMLLRTWLFNVHKQKCRLPWPSHQRNSWFCQAFFFCTSSGEKFPKGDERFPGWTSDSKKLQGKSQLDVIFHKAEQEFDEMKGWQNYSDRLFHLTFAWPKNTISTPNDFWLLPLFSLWKKSKSCLLQDDDDWLVVLDCRCDDVDSVPSSYFCPWLPFTTFLTSREIKHIHEAKVWKLGWTLLIMYSHSVCIGCLVVFWGGLSMVPKVSRVINFPSPICKREGGNCVGNGKGHIYVFIWWSRIWHCMAI